MPVITLRHTIVAGQPALAADVQENFEDVRDGANALDGDNLATAFGQRLGASSTSVVRSGQSIVAAAESTTSATYVLLTTHDEVANISVAAGALLRVRFFALAKLTGAAAGHVGLFLNSTQVVIPDGTGGGGTVPVEVGLTTGSTNYGPVSTGFNTDTAYAVGGRGLVWISNTAADATVNAAAGTVLAASNPASTGNRGSAGTELEIKVAAGTYTVSLRFKAAAGATVSAKERYLYVETRLP
jgi:hypothetical protein